MSTSGGTTLDSVRALEDDFADAMSRMYSVGNDLARLRSSLAREASPAEWTPVSPTAPEPAADATSTTEQDESDTQPVPVVAAAPPAPSTPPAPGTPPAPSTPPAGPGNVTPPPFAGAPSTTPPVPPTPAGPPTQPWWQRDGVVAKVLAGVGAGITLIGVAFLLALAIQMGFFGPVARVVSGALLAAGLVVAAVLVRRRQDNAIGALGLAATGIATAYLDILAVTRIYEWVPTAAGLVLAGLVALGGLLLARAWASQLLAIITVAGVAVFAPTVGYDDLLLTGAFLVVLTIASWPAQISRDWPFLEMARIIPTAFFTGGLVGMDEPMWAVTLLAGAYTTFVLASSLAGARVGGLPRQLGPLVPIAAMPMLLAGLAADNRWLATSLLVVLTCLLVLVAGLAGETRETALHHRLTEVSLGTAGVTSLLAAVRLAESSGWAVAATVVVSLLWAGAALALRHRMTLYVALATSALTLLGSLYLLPFLLLRRTSPDVAMPELVTALGIVVLLLVLSEAVTRSLPVLAPVVPRVLVAGAVLWAGGAVILAGVLTGHLLDDPHGGFTAGQTGATLLWLGTAAVLLLRGLRGSSVAVPAGLAIAAFSVGKLLFFDLAFLSGIARVLSFIVGGLLLLAMGAGYAQALERSRRRGPEAVDNSPAAGPVPPTV